MVADMSDQDSQSCEQYLCNGTGFCAVTVGETVEGFQKQESKI